MRFRLVEKINRFGNTDNLIDDIVLHRNDNAWTRIRYWIAKNMKFDFVSGAPVNTGLG